jgi:hypothetical protein
MLDFVFRTDLSWRISELITAIQSCCGGSSSRVTEGIDMYNAVCHVVIDLSRG